MRNPILDNCNEIFIDFISNPETCDPFTKDTWNKAEQDVIRFIRDAKHYDYQQIKDLESKGLVSTVAADIRAKMLRLGQVAYGNPDAEFITVMLNRWAKGLVTPEPDPVAVWKYLGAVVQRYKRCEKSGNKGWRKVWLKQINAIVGNHLPSGSGFDKGCGVNITASESDKLVIEMDYHPMDEWGGYISWVHIRATIVLNFETDYDISLEMLENQNDPREFDAEATLEYTAETLSVCLDQMVDQNILKV